LPFPFSSKKVCQMFAKPFSPSFYNIFYPKSTRKKPFGKSQIFQRKTFVERWLSDAPSSRFDCHVACSDLVDMPHLRSRFHCHIAFTCQIGRRQARSNLVDGKKEPLEGLSKFKQAWRHIWCLINNFYFYYFLYNI
jgi:hypothetical protein